MKKFLLMMCLAAMAGTSYGYDFKKWVGPMFYIMSSDGKYLVHTSGEGDVMLYNTADSTYTYFADESGDYYYEAGLGNALNNMGMLVGAIDNYTPGYLYNGVWTALPLPEGYSGNYPQGNGITADGKYICGSISSGIFGTESSSTSIQPVVWTRGDDGTYGVCEVLPFPEKDFAGATPQYVTAICISDDGNVVVGQVQSGSGFCCYPIVYKKDADGKWSYTLPGLSNVVREGYEGKIPPFPSSYPESVDAGEYLTSEELSAYTDAMTAYTDSVNGYYQDLNDYPTYYPQKRDFIKTKANEYNAAVDVYNAAATAYNDSIEAYYEAYNTYATGSSYVFNTLALSPNGKYLGQVLQSEDPDAEPGFDGETNAMNVPMIFNIEDGTITSVEAKDMTITSITNDGLAITASPAMEYTRNSYVVPAGTTQPVDFAEWVSSKCPAFTTWSKENMGIDFYKYEYDDDGNETMVSVPDSVITGTVICNSDATIFSSYLYDYWAEDESEAGFKSYLIDIADPENASTKIAATRKEIGDVKVVGRYSVDGRKLSVPARGLNIVRMSDGTARKVLVK